MRRDWSIEAATQALVELRPLIALLREQRASLESLKGELLVLRRLERAGARPGGSDQSDLQAVDADPSAQSALVTSSLVEVRIRALVDQMQASVDRLAGRGVELRDIERGLVDFPATAFGRPFHLCWEESDGESVGFAHGLGEGFGSRLPIGEFLRRHAHSERGI
ncbi:MAG: hypothetical protein RL006_311 [Chloroflexota bacterium]|jgi:hypothetical protein